MIREGSAPPGEEDAKTRLRRLRDRLAIEAPRARVRAKVPPEVIEQLESAVEQVTQMYLLAVAPSTPASTALEEAQEDAIAEGHLALAAWERCQASAKEAKPSRPPSSPGINRREHERIPTTATVKLLRHTVQKDGRGALSLDAASSSRPARNVSLGGIFVTLAKEELPQIGVGHVLHVSVTPAQGSVTTSYELTATVVRREESGVGLRWILRSEREQRLLDGLLDAIHSTRPTR